jgi:hypothetical protein
MVCLTRRLCPKGSAGPHQLVGTTLCLPEFSSLVFKEIRPTATDAPGRVLPVTTVRTRPRAVMAVLIHGSRCRCMSRLYLEQGRQVAFERAKYFRGKSKLQEMRLEPA